MKLFFIILILLAAVFAAFQFYLFMSTTKVKTQPYTILRDQSAQHEFQIRYYPPSTIATIHANVTSYKDLGSLGFRKLAAYIFGGNDSNKQIAMTSPVQMDINDTNSSMSFVMPEDFNLRNLPTPNNKEVQLSTTIEENAAVLSFGGFASDSKIEKFKSKLKALLEAESIPFYGNFRYLGYNPPYQLFGRKNEIIVSIIWKPNS